MKYHLTFEFRYPDHTRRIITIGIYDDLREAIKAGNESLDKLFSDG